MTEQNHDINLMDVVNLYNDMRAVFREEWPCEVSNHGTGQHHSGTGTWYVLYKCPRCGDADATLLCEQFCIYLRSVLDTHQAPCTDCDQQVPLRDAITGFEKRGK